MCGKGPRGPTFTPVDPIHAAVSRFLRAHGIERELPLLAAISGGADSIALLHVLDRARAVQRFILARERIDASRVELADPGRGDPGVKFSFDAIPVPD